jgi:hypothetical protein
VVVGQVGADVVLLGACHHDVSRGVGAEDVHTG